MKIQFKIIQQLLFYCILTFSESSVNSQRVKLTDIEILTFFKERFTTGRRLSPVPQVKNLKLIPCFIRFIVLKIIYFFKLQCDSKLRLLSYSNCYKFQPNIVQCYNRGLDGNEVRWECKADLDKRVRFSSLKVSCEGYEFTDDPYVLYGSCGVGLFKSAIF